MTMSKHPPDLSNDYVAELLKRDAKNISGHNASLTSLASGRAAPANRKPNLRFLNNIIRETDTHNSALKLRELEQAGDRLRQLRGDPPRELSQRTGRRDDSSPRSSEAQRRSRRDDEGKRRPRSRSRSPRHDRSRYTSRREDRSKDRGKDYGSRRHHRSSRRANRSPRSADEDKAERSDLGSDAYDNWRQSRRRERRHRTESYDESDRDESSGREVKDRAHEKRDKRPQRRRRERSKERRRHDLLDNPQERSSGRLSRSPPDPNPRKDEHHYTKPRKESLSLAPGNTGPPAPVLRRGRGTHTSSSSAMDARFLSTYDPKADLQPELTHADADDWDRALEAARDRAQWQKTQADRLRAAGFSDGDLERWEKNIGDGVEDNVVWKGKGEGREWDRGKVLQEDGNVSTKVGWPGI